MDDTTAELIRNAVAEITTMQRQLSAVRDLHVPFDAPDGRRCCCDCIAGYDPRTGDLVHSMYPCRTARAAGVTNG